MHYTIVLDPNPATSASTVSVPALPGWVTEGDTFEEALANLREASAGFIETLIRLGEPVAREESGLAVVSIEVPDDVEGSTAEAVA
jgi:predicted RNase H-like HicB family nuclease